MTLSQIVITCILTSIIVYLIIDFIEWLKHTEEFEKEEWRRK